MRKSNFGKWITVIILTMVLSCSTKVGVESVSAAVDDVSNEAGSAATVTVGTAKTAYMNSGDDVDFFMFSTNSTDSFYEIKVKNVNSNRIRYAIYGDIDLTEKLLEFHIDNHLSMGGSFNTHNMGKLSPNKTYYIQVWNDGGDVLGGKYQVEVTNVVDDVKDTAKDATSFPVGKTKTAYMNNSGDIDYFKFKTDKTDSFYKITFKNVDVNRIRYAVYADEDLTEKLLEFHMDRAASNTHNLVKLSKNKTYYVQVWNDGGDVTKGKYKIDVKKTKDDVQDTVAKAKTLKLNSVYSSYKLQNEKDVDFFKVKTSNYKDYTLSFANLSKKGRIWIEVYSGKDCLDNQKIVNTYCDAKGSINSTIAKLKLGYNKTYYIRISGAEDSKYKVGLSATPPQSVKAKKANTGSKKKVTLTWKKVNRATGYEIYRATSKNGKYTKVATIGKAGTLKYTDGKNLKKGKIYYYKIRAYRKTSKGKIYSAYSTIKSIKIK